VSVSVLVKADEAMCPQLVGYPCVPVDINQLATFKAAAYAAKVKYGFGAKDPHVGSGVIDFDDIDCSGWARTMTDYATHNVLRSAGFPDGSYNQAMWLVNVAKFKSHRIESVQDYIDCAEVNDNLYRLCFHLPGGRGGDSIGHVWGDMHLHTSESYGGHGPGERTIDHQWFLDHCDIVVVIGPMVPHDQWTYPGF